MPPTSRPRRTTEWSRRPRSLLLRSVHALGSSGRVGAGALGMHQRMLLPFARAAPQRTTRRGRRRRWRARRPSSQPGRRGRRCRLHGGPRLPVRVLRECRVLQRRLRWALPSMQRGGQRRRARRRMRTGERRRRSERRLQRRALLELRQRRAVRRAGSVPHTRAGHRVRPADLRKRHFLPDEPLRRSGSVCGGRHDQLRSVRVCRFHLRQKLREPRRLRSGCGVRITALRRPRGQRRALRDAFRLQEPVLRRRRVLRRGMRRALSRLLRGKKGDSKRQRRVRSDRAGTGSGRRVPDG